MKILYDADNKLVENLLGFIKPEKKIDLIPIVRNKNKFFLYLGYLIPFLYKKILSEKTLKKIFEISKTDDILFFDYFYTPILKKVYKIRQTKNLVWIWNPIKHSFIEKIRFFFIKVYSQVYTFDSQDAKYFNIDLRKQVMYKSVIKEIPEQTCDFYFIGYDKGRYSKLNSLYKQLKNYGFKTNIIILKDSSSGKSDKFGLQYSEKIISDEENIRNIMQSKIVLDIQQTGQRGMTRRPLEAFFLGKKLATFSPTIFEDYSDICNDSNTLVIKDDLSKDKIEKFIITDFNINSDKLNKYEINTWIDNFHE